jgi:branched-subunit amino acid aminotransferase/4-amino-4-deoxychorismate lyase
MTDEPVSLIETMRVDPGNRITLLEGHLTRLHASCTALGYDWPGDDLIAAVQRHGAALDAGSTHRLRLLVGTLRSYSIETSALAPTPEPVSVRLSQEPLKADPFWLRHKTTHRPWYAVAQRWLDDHPECFDLIFCNERDELCEGTRTNVYVRDGAGNWLTPPLDSGVLPGVKRQALLDAGCVHEAALSRRDFLSASSIRVSNALRGWLDARLDTRMEANADPIMRG